MDCSSQFLRVKFRSGDIDFLPILLDEYRHEFGSNLNPRKKYKNLCRCIDTLIPSLVLRNKSLLLVTERSEG